MDTTVPAARAALYEDIRRLNLIPLWESLHSLVPAHPAPAHIAPAPQNVYSSAA